MGISEIKSILVITDAFGKPLYLPRMRFLCNYLYSVGINVTLVTEKFESLPFNHDYPILEIPLYNCKGRFFKLEWFVKNILNIFFDYKNKTFSKRVYKFFRDKDFDVVCCSTFHTFSLRAAGNLSTKKKIPLFVDIRDLAEQCNNNEYANFKFSLFQKNIVGYIYRKINICRRNKILRKANCITSVSPWHVNFLMKLNHNVHLVYNGYDPDLFFPERVISSKFRIVYTGKWYSKNMQDPTLLFEALHIMVSLDTGNFKNDVVVDFYTSSECQKRFRLMAELYGLQSIVEFHDYVPNEDVPKILNESSIILVLSNKGTHGIMTTKFFEAIGVEKPVLCVRSDEGFLSYAIKESDIGVAAVNVDETVDFIIKCYNQWKTEGVTSVDIMPSIKIKYSRKEQSKQFLELFESFKK